MQLLRASRCHHEKLSGVILERSAVHGLISLLTSGSNMSCPLTLSVYPLQVPYTQPERALFLFTKWVTKSTSVTPDDVGTFY